MSLRQKLSLEKEFISYEEALALKELGFDEPCLAGYSQDEYGSRLCLMNILSDGLLKNPEDEDCICLAPIYGQAFRWFRDKHDLPSHIASYWQHDWNNYSYEWNIVENHEQWNVIEHFKTYEEAELECLKQLIKIVKEKK